MCIEYSKIVIFCEHIDITSFVSVYIKYLRTQGINLQPLRIVNIKGLKNLPLYLKKLEQVEGFENVDKILLIANAGAKRRATEHNIFKAKLNSFLKDFNFEVYLFPKKSEAGNWTPGYLEDLLVLALRKETSECSYFYNLHNIAHEYIFSVNNSRGKENHLINYNRNFLYSYLSGTEKYVGLRLGEAANEGAFDLEHECFKDLREFLSKHTSM